LHELNTRIHQRLNQEGIELAFPQRDLHIRSIPPQMAKWFERTKP
jgi:potassium-dependent mechanosensitive channel